LLEESIQIEFEGVAVERSLTAAANRVYVLIVALGVSNLT